MFFRFPASCSINKAPSLPFPTALGSFSRNPPLSSANFPYHGNKNQIQICLYQHLETAAVLLSNLVAASVSGTLYMILQIQAAFCNHQPSAYIIHIQYHCTLDIHQSLKLLPDCVPSSTSPFLIQSTNGVLAPMKVPANFIYRSSVPCSLQSNA